ncbi:hypothetical protein B566_EDAN007715 [Ephemera danica]|nr:hypothetical protein B566_EDAN007715 [Ephemera danica]
MSSSVAGKVIPQEIFTNTTLEMVDSDVFQKFVEYPPENGTITKDLVKDPEDDVVDIKLCGTKIIKVEPDRYRAIREKTNYEDVPTHPNILKYAS